jgi:hypothetical protein
MLFKNIKYQSFVFGLFVFAIMASCKKDSSSSSGGGGNPLPYKLSYADSVLFPLGESNNLQIINPVTAKSGVYTVFPEGLDINNSTGAINVHESETGIKYRVYFTSFDGATKDSTLITVSGLNYLDGVYKINATDSILNPVYNATIGNSLPGGSLFDEGGGCNNNGCSVNITDAKVNLAQTVRNGTFGSTPTNGSNREFTLNFRVNDRSQKGGNKTKLKVFYFRTINDVTQQVWDLLNTRNGTVINSFNNNNNTPIQGFTGTNIVQNSTSGKGRRPPCIVILSQ